MKLYYYFVTFKKILSTVYMFIDFKRDRRRRRKYASGGNKKREREKYIRETSIAFTRDKTHNPGM